MPCHTPGLRDCECRDADAQMIYACQLDVDRKPQFQFYVNVICETFTLCHVMSRQLGDVNVF